MDLDLLLKKLTVEEKCRILVGKDFWHTADIEGQSLPTFKMSDGPHGLRKQDQSGDRGGSDVKDLHDSAQPQHHHGEGRFW